MHSSARSGHCSVEASTSLSQCKLFAHCRLLSAAPVLVACAVHRDKAGGYGYQSVAATMVREIHGCYYNVVGFPLHQIAAQLQPHLDRLIAAAEKRQAQTPGSGAAAAPAVSATDNQ